MNSRLPHTYISELRVSDCFVHALTWMLKDKKKFDRLSQPHVPILPGFGCLGDSLKDRVVSLSGEKKKFLPSHVTFAHFSVCCVHFYLLSCQIEGRNQCDNSFLTRQSSVSMSPSLWSGRARSGLSTLLDPSPSTRSLRRSGRRHSRSPPPLRSCSIPIIPAVQCHNDSEASCMQTSLSPANNMMSMSCKEEKRKKHTALACSSCSSAIGQQQDEVVLLLEEAQEQLRALVLAHRKQEEGGFGSTAEPRETVCFLNLNGNGGPTSCNGPTQTQLLSPSLSHRDLGQSSH